GKSHLRVVIMATPVDADHSIAFYYRSRRARGWKRWQWWLAWWTTYRRAVNKIAGEDRDAMEGIGPLGVARLHEHLAASDAGVIHLRRRLRRAFAVSQADAQPLASDDDAEAAWTNR